jgi:hypothetical protein
MPTFTIYPNLDLYDSGIVDGLIELGHSPENALALVQTYEAVIRKIGRYDNPEDISLRIHHSLQKGSTPELWLKHIEAMKRYAEPRTYYLTKPPVRKGIVKAKKRVAL